MTPGNLESAPRNTSNSLTLHLLSFSDLGRETSLDSGDGPTGSARVAGDEVKTVLSLVQLRIGGAARLAGDVLDWNDVSS
jgi:hypothetical protein